MHNRHKSKHELQVEPKVLKELKYMITFCHFILSLVACEDQL